MSSEEISTSTPKTTRKSVGEENEDDKKAISVKDRAQKFNRLASIEDENTPSPKFNKATERQKKDKVRIVDHFKLIGFRILQHFFFVMRKVRGK